MRMNYLGSSIHGVPDKYKKGPEAFWYAKEPRIMGGGKDEIENVKNKEKQMMEALLGGGGVSEKSKSKQFKEQRRDLSPDRRTGQNDGGREHDVNRIQREEPYQKYSGTSYERQSSRRFERRDTSERDSRTTRHGGPSKSHYEKDYDERKKDAYERGSSRHHSEEASSRDSLKKSTRKR